MSKSLDVFKKQALIKTLKSVGGCRTTAADELRVSVRTIRNWVKKYDLAKENFDRFLARFPEDKEAVEYKQRCETSLDTRTVK